MIFVAALISLLGVSACELYLTLRQRRQSVITTSLPECAKEIATEEQYRTSRLYILDKLKFGIFSHVFDTVVSIASLALFIYPRLWSWLQIQMPKSGEITQSLVFGLIFMVIGEVVKIPFALYSDFVVEEKHGFNKKTYKIFVTDLMKSFAIELIIGAPVLVVFIFFVKWAGPQCYIYIFFAFVIFSLVMIQAYPVLIAPLFNKFEPLKNQELKIKIENLAKEHKFPLTKLYEVDNSVRSSHSNAYMYGFGNNKRIVLYDTILKIPHEQIVAVLAHELGHWAHSHMIRFMLFFYAQTFAFLYLFKIAMFNPKVISAFGFDSPDLPVIGGIIAFSTLISPLSFVTGTLAVVLSRCNEFQADRYAVNSGQGEELYKALVSITADNKGNLAPDWLYAWFNYTHPPVPERLSVMKSLTDKSK